MNNLLTLTPAEFCAATNACVVGRVWATTQATMADVWDYCPRAEWLVWIAQKTNAANDRTLRLFAVWCARSTPLGDGRVTGDLLTNPRSLAALETAKRYAYGKATKRKLADARHAAYAVNHAVYLAVSDDLAWTRATYAVYSATLHDAVYAAEQAARHASLAALLARDIHSARLVQANQFRLTVKNPFPRKEAQP